MLRSARRATLGLATVLGLRRAGWFLPYRYAASLPAPGESPAYPAVERSLAAARPAFVETLAAIDRHAAALRAIADGGAEAGEGKPPRFDQAWFPTLDAAATYAILRERRPRRIVEVGSGHSTRFLARAASDGGYDCEILAIDPAPRADIGRLARVEVRRETLHRAGTAAFAGLAPRDVLFVDSSHLLMPGSDVDLLFNRVLPELPDGALVHIHDVLLPDDYPRAWAWRNYNEQQGVAPLLLFGGFRPLFASHYVATRMAEAAAASAAASLPRHPAGFPTSLWLVKGG